MRIHAIVLVVALAVAGSALACGDPSPTNLVATPALKAALVDAFVTAHPRLHLDPAQVDRVAGHTYYGSFGDDYAVATFVTPSATWPPTILTRRHGGRWHVLRQTHGGICGRFVPEPLLVVWSLRRWRGDCFVEPA